MTIVVRFIRPYQPVMVPDRRTYTSDGRIVEYARGVQSGSRFSWTYSFEIPEKPLQQ